MSDTREITVVVYDRTPNADDQKKVASVSITYYAGQTYNVQIVTPDGVDARTVELKAGQS